MPANSDRPLRLYFDLPNSWDEEVREAADRILGPYGWVEVAHEWPIEPDMPPGRQTLDITLFENSRPREWIVLKHWDTSRPEKELALAILNGLFERRMFLLRRIHYRYEMPRTARSRLSAWLRRRWWRFLRG